MTSYVTNQQLCAQCQDHIDAGDTEAARVVYAGLEARATELNRMARSLLELVEFEEQERTDEELRELHRMMEPLGAQL